MQISGKVVVITGGSGGIGRAMAERIADATYVEVPRTGHLINIEEADIFNDAVLAFLAKHS